MKTEKRRVKLGITIGDINGVGPEVILKTLKDNRLLDEVTPVIFAPLHVIGFYRKNLKISNFHFKETKDFSNIGNRNIYIYPIEAEQVSVQTGKITKEAGTIALEALEACVNALKNGQIDAMLTAPINKDNIQSDDFAFPGHTEYLKDRFEADDSLMIMVNDHLKIAQVTGHIPLKEVAHVVTEELVIKKTKLFEQSLRKDFRVRRPKIALLSINPHAGDQGVIGTEEKDFLIPTIEKIQDEHNILAYGPFAADGFFGSSEYKNYDGVLAMYHDQGLIPFKTLSFNNGVNYTAGLSIVRTSPDHGTGYDIAGKRMAAEDSFRKALYTAVDIFHTRLTEEQLEVNKIDEKEIKKTLLNQRNNHQNKRNSDKRNPKNKEQKSRQNSATQEKSKPVEKKQTKEQNNAEDPKPNEGI